jgi:hypothetical protein
MKYINRPIRLFAIAVAVIYFLFVATLMASAKEKRLPDRCEPTPRPTTIPIITPTPIATPSASPTIIPTATPEPNEPVINREAGSAPTCGTGAITVKPVNAHLIRHSTWGEIKYVPTGGSEVNIYYKDIRAKDWQHSVRDEKNDGYVVIRNLDSKTSYTFGLQQKNSCGGGDILIAVDPPVTKPQIFLFK